MATARLREKPFSELISNARKYVFMSMDIDHDGTVTFAEIAQALLRSDAVATWQASTDNQEKEDPETVRVIGDGSILQGSQRLKMNRVSMDRLCGGGRAGDDPTAAATSGRWREQAAILPDRRRGWSQMRISHRAMSRKSRTTETLLCPSSLGWPRLTASSTQHECTQKLRENTSCMSKALVHV